MEPVSHVREHTHCRVCQSERLETYLDLGVQPLANAFRASDDPATEIRAPLVLARCLDCGLSQLRHVVDRDILYRNYLYESGHSAGWREHCEALAGEIAQNRPRAMVCDIACNDGTLLDTCQRNGLGTIGVDPAQNLSPTLSPRLIGYWGTEFVSKYFAAPVFDVIVAQNVIGHVDDVGDFLRATKAALKPDGVAIIECPHVIPLLEATAFDTVYHEHLSYWSLESLWVAASYAGLQVIYVTPLPNMHGGSFRYYLTHEDVPPAPACEERLEQMLKWERRVLTETAYSDFGREVKYTLGRLARVLNESAPVIAYGASAKSTVLLNALAQQVPEWCPCTITTVFDETPGKVGLTTPGLGLPITAPPADMSGIPTLLITAPNWKDSILATATARGFTGTVITPWHGVQTEAACPASS